MTMSLEDVQRIRQIAEFDADGLARLDAIQQGTVYWTQVLAEAVRLAREQGATWQQIGEALGVSAQAAHERFTKGRLSVVVSG